jgi:uncharacterized protein (TIGR02996 family)
MTTHDDLLRAILREPDDDDLRLVYADWLEEYGDPVRAEFIRVQIRMFGVWPADIAPACWKVVDGHMDCGCVFCALRRCERELLEPTKGAWLGFTDSLPGWWCCGWQGPCGYRLYHPDERTKFCEVQFTRGFVSSIELTTADFLAHAAAIFAAQPVTAVRLSDREPYVSEVHVGDYWWFRDRVPGSPLHNLPVELFELLKNPGPFPAARKYKSIDAALADLSTSCISYAHSLHPELFAPALI